MVFTHKLYDIETGYAKDNQTFNFAKPETYSGDKREPLACLGLYHNPSHTISA